MRHPIVLVSILGIACGDAKPRASSPPPPAPSAVVVSSAPSAIAPAPAPAPTAVASAASPPPPSGAPFAVPERPANEIGCFAIWAAQGVGACMSGTLWKKKSGNAPSFKLVWLALQPNVIPPKSVDIDVNAAGILSPESRRATSEALRGHSPWSPGAVGKAGVVELNGFRLRSFSVAYDPGGPPVMTIRADTPGSNDSQLLGGGTDIPKSTELRAFAGTAAGYVAFEFRSRGGTGSEGDAIAWACNEKEGVCHAGE